MLQVDKVVVVTPDSNFDSRVTPDSSFNSRVTPPGVETGVWSHSGDVVWSQGGGGGGGGVYKLS